ncbi:MAG: hypothetical protein HXY43_22875 [Fischerella sp.]|nr:hypothetical protein [Fischerella sp.]
MYKKYIVYINTPPSALSSGLCHYIQSSMSPSVFTSLTDKAAQQNNQCVEETPKMT